MFTHGHTRGTRPCPTCTQVQVGVNAASENLQAATREAACKVREAESREAPLQVEVARLRLQLETGRAAAAAFEEEVVAQRELECTVREELGAAREGWRKTRTELEGLRRRQLLESEESGSKEEALVGLQHAQHAQLEAALDAQREAEERLGETAARAAQLDRARQAAEDRCAEQAVALGNLQGVLEHLQSQATPPASPGGKGSLVGRVWRSGRAASRRDRCSPNSPSPRPRPVRAGGRFLRVGAAALGRPGARAGVASAGGGEHPWRGGSQCAPAVAGGPVCSPGA